MDNMQLTLESDDQANYCFGAPIFEKLTEVHSLLYRRQRLEPNTNKKALDEFCRIDISSSNSNVRFLSNRLKRGM